MQTSEVELTVPSDHHDAMATRNRERSFGHRSSTAVPAPTGGVQHTDKKKKVQAAIGLGVALLAIVGVIVGAVVGTAKKDAPPAVNAVAFKPADWEKVMVGEKTQPPLSLNDAKKVLGVMTWPGALTSYNVIGLCEYAGSELRTNILQQIGVTTPKPPPGGWAAFPRGGFAACFDPNWPVVVSVNSVAGAVANCTAETKLNGPLEFSISVDSLGALPGSFTEETMRNSSSVYMHALAQCIVEKSQFHYVRSEIDRQLARMSATASAPSVGFVGATRRLLSHFTAAEPAAQVPPFEAQSSAELSERRMHAERRRMHAERRGAKTFSSDQSVTPYQLAYKYAIDVYDAIDPTNPNHFDTTISTQLKITVENGWTIIAFRGTEPTVLADILTDLAIDPSKGGWYQDSNGFSKTWDGDTCYTCMDYGHGGFMRAYGSEKSPKGQTAREFVTAYLSKTKPTKVVFTGHSLGGALSALAFTDLFHFGAHWSGSYNPNSVQWRYVGYAPADPFANVPIVSDLTDRFQAACKNNQDNCAGFINEWDIVPCAAEWASFRAGIFGNWGGYAIAPKGWEERWKISCTYGLWSYANTPCSWGDIGSTLYYAPSKHPCWARGVFYGSYSVTDHSLDKYSWVTSH